MAGTKANFTASLETGDGPVKAIRQIDISMKSIGSAMGNCAVNTISYVTGAAYTKSAAKDFRGNQINTPSSFTLREAFACLDKYTPEQIYSILCDGGYKCSMFLLSDNVLRYSGKGGSSSYGDDYVPPGMDTHLSYYNGFLTYHFALYIQARPKLGTIIRLPLAQTIAGGHRDECLATVWVWYPRQELVVDWELKKSNWHKKSTHTQYPSLFKKATKFKEAEEKITNDVSTIENQGLSGKSPDRGTEVGAAVPQL